MESKGFMFNYQHLAREDAPSFGSPVRLDEGHQEEKDLLERLTELTGLLKKLIRQRDDGTLESILVSKSRLESNGWGTDRELDLYERLDPESRRIKRRSSLDVIDSVFSGLRNAEPDLTREWKDDD